MANVIKLRKGLDINLKGKAANKLSDAGACDIYGLVPDDFTGLKPKVVVKEGDVVKAGDALFVNKLYPEVRFVSPVSGTVEAIVRGEKRKLLEVRVKADKTQEYVDFGVKKVKGMDADQVKKALLESGLWPALIQRPYGVLASPDIRPKAIFVSAFNTAPLAADLEYALRDEFNNIQTGIDALAKLTDGGIHISFNSENYSGTPFHKLENVIQHTFTGKHPAGNVGVQINHIDPVNKGETVWTLGAEEAIFAGRLLRTGRLDLTRRIALAGWGVNEAGYVETIVGTPMADLVEGNLKTGRNLRIIDGNPLVGRKSGTDGFLGAHSTEVCVIPEGDDVNEVLGWAAPRLKDFSTSRSYFSWLMGKGKKYNLDCRIKGGERHIIMSGEYDRVLPMDIYAGYLIKAILTGDIDRQEALGIYEVAPEDFAVAEFVDSSKLELQRIVREGLDLLRKENA